MSRFEIEGDCLVEAKLLLTQTDGNEYITSLADGYVDIEATTGIRLNAETLATEKIIFTQTDGNEYIDSLADGYLDLGGTTAIRLLSGQIILDPSTNVQINSADDSETIQIYNDNTYGQFDSTVADNYFKVTTNQAISGYGVKTNRVAPDVGYLGFFNDTAQRGTFIWTAGGLFFQPAANLPLFLGWSGAAGENIHMNFDSATDGDNSYVYIYGKESGVAKRYGRLRVNTTGEFEVEAEAGQGIALINNQQVSIGAGTKHDGYVIKSAAEVQTANAVQTTLDSITLLDANTYYAEAWVTGAKNDGTDRAAYSIACTVYRTGAGGATLQGAVTVIHSQESAAAWDATFTVNGNDLRVSVTGVAATTIEWSGTLKYINVSET